MNVAGFLSCVEHTWIDLPNAVLNSTDAKVLSRLRDVTQFDFTICRMSTTHIGLLINAAVSFLEPDECYLNIGVWQGYSFFAGVVGNIERRCVGNDDFSLYRGNTGLLGAPDALGRDFGDPKAAFFREYTRVKSDRTSFYEGDFRDLLRDWRQQFGHPVGFYFYDGDHSYAAHLDGLNDVVQHLSPDCALLVDDTNVEHIAQANRHFLSQNTGFRLVLDLPTPANRFPTWWNGVQVLVRENEDAA